MAPETTVQTLRCSLESLDQVLENNDMVGGLVIDYAHCLLGALWWLIPETDEPSRNNSSTS
jgi:hypothetical protein